MFDLAAGGEWITPDLDEGAVLAGLTSVEECERLLVFARAPTWKGPGADGYAARRSELVVRVRLALQDMEDLYALAVSRNQLARSVSAVL